MTPLISREINDILHSLEGWEKGKYQYEIWNLWKAKRDLGVNSKSTAAFRSVDIVDRKTLIIVNNVNVCQQKNLTIVVDA